MFVLALALLAQDTEKVEGWTIASDVRKDECVLSARLVSGGDVSFHWRPRKRAGVMLFRAPEFRSIEQGKAYKIDVGFQKGGKLDMGWGKKSATGNVSPDGTRGFLIGFSGDEILDDLAASTKLGFWYKDKLVGAVPLNGSGKAVAAVRRCGAALLKQGSPDPFEE
ncbi:hypothetical protein FHS95_002414 [Sphingomonas naasensis]|uniref:Uncharacterized protein n=1 Tax=Sphingomonas naasensis TaxID=1344951 RepID=A0A4S1WMG0_9SPHN|nr:hypothetical protein [Sphingomonas naasensis]NIJ20722.1 hypothetical protein [Sphingomonas naasensis]TGX43137.1 hypothetical protein E5A74_08115 [Sphingomonas naasensis]